MRQNDALQIWHRSPAASMAEDLGLEILNGSVRPGEKLATELVLCGRYGVSRTVAREALQALAAKGLIASRPRVGAVVCSVEDWHFLDADIIRWTESLGEDCQFYDAILEARIFLEPQFASIAAIRASPDDLETIERAVVGMETAVDAGNLEAFHSADLEFHLGILHATHNIVLRRFGDLLRAAMRTGFRKSVANKPVSNSSLRLHRETYEAIRNRNPEHARECLHKLALDLEESLDVGRSGTIDGYLS